MARYSEIAADAGRVLVVDNDPPMVELIEESLRSARISCLTAASGTEALGLLRSRDDIMVVVTDIRMPEMDGFDLIDAIGREWPETDRPGIVLISGYLDQEATIHALRTRVYDCLSKPFSRHQLLEMVLRCFSEMAEKRAQRERARLIEEMLLRLRRDVDEARLELGSLRDPKLAEARRRQGLDGADGLLDEDEVGRRTLLVAGWWRQLGELMHPGFMASPAWTILLETFTHSFEGRKSYITGLAVSAGVPLSTVSRYADSLEEHGLVERHSDPADGRRVLLRLTPKGAAVMARCMSMLELPI